MAVSDADRLRALMRPGQKGALALVLLARPRRPRRGRLRQRLGKEADEGVPIQLGDLKFNVQETRFLNPCAARRQGVPRRTAAAYARRASSYLGVFLTIHNTATIRSGADQRAR